VSWCVSVWASPVWHSLGFLGLGGYFLSHVREVLNCNLFQYFLIPFHFLPLGPNVSVLNVVMEVSETVLFFHSFFILLCFHYFHHSMFQLTYPVFCLNDSAVVLLKCIFLFFIPITVLSLNTFCIFSTHTSILFIYASILFLRFWIIFTIITLNSFSGRLPMSSPFVWSCWFFTMLLHLLYVSLSFHFV